MTSPSTRPLAECGRLLSGGTPSKARADYWEGSIPWFSSKEIRSFELASTELGVTQVAVDEGATLVPPGTVLFVVRGMSLANEFRVGVTGVEATFNQDVKAVVPTSDVDARYLARCLRWLQPDVLSRAEESTHGTKRLAGRIYESLAIPLPPLAEQRRIAGILDAADALRAKRRAALAEVYRLGAAMFVDLFGDPIADASRWPHRPLGELLEAIDSGNSPVCLSRPAEGSEWGVLKLGAVTWCEYDPSENKALPASVAADPALEVMPGDLLFTRKNTHELVGACALVRETPARLLLPDLIFRLRPRRAAPVNTAFLHQLLIHPTKRRAIQALAGGTAGSMPNISKARLRTTPIPTPPTALQDDFARQIAAVDALKVAHSTSLAELDALFASLQHRAFRGEL